jgi:hypothetical protein
VRLIKALYLPWPDKNGPKTKQPTMPDGPKQAKNELKKIMVDRPLLGP